VDVNIDRYPSHVSHEYILSTNSKHTQKKKKKKKKKSTFGVRTLPLYFPTSKARTFSKVPNPIRKDTFTPNISIDTLVFFMQNIRPVVTIQTVKQ
jgi:hypothetical protein